MRRGTEDSCGVGNSLFLDLGSDYTDVIIKFIITHYAVHLYLMQLSVCELYFTIKSLNRNKIL